MKKLLAILTVCVMTFTLTACSGNGNSSAESASSVPGTSSVLETQSSEVPEASEGSDISGTSEIQESSAEPSSEAESSEAGTSSAPSSQEPQSSSIASQAPVESSQPETSEPSSEPSQEPENSSDALVVYFSWSGNTESVANEIQAQTGADIFEIVPAEPYTDDYNTLLDIAQQEQADDVRPAIADTVDVSGYETIFLGYPNWWGDMPMIVYTFLDDYDLSGKTIAPFVTSGGSGFSNTISAIEELEPDAEVADGLSLGSSQASNPGDAVSEWLSSIGLAA